VCFFIKYWLLHININPIGCYQIYLFFTLTVFFDAKLIIFSAMLLPIFEMAEIFQAARSMSEAILHSHSQLRKTLVIGRR